MSNNTKASKIMGMFMSVELITFLASFLSFPIFTRLLSKSDYGVMNLMQTGVMLLVSLTSCGLGSSVLRYYSKYDNKERHDFIVTIRNATFIASVIGTTLFIVLSLIYVKRNFVGVSIIPAIIASPLIVIRLMDRIEQSFYRIQERFITLNVIALIGRYLGVFLSVYMVIQHKNITSYFVGLVTAETIMLVCIYIYSYKNRIGFPVKFDINVPVYLRAVYYGMPLAASSILTYFMAGLDRYIIGYYYGTERVAEYAVIFNYCSYPIEPVKNIFIATYIPMIMNSWNSGDTSSKPMSDYISAYFWIVSPLIFGLFTIENEGIKLLAGNKYHTLPGIVPLLALAMSVSGMNFVFTGGLLFKGMSKAILYLTALCGLLNTVLNICLIGRIGVYGAAISSLISYLMFSAIAYRYSKKYIEYSLPYRQIILALSSASIMVIGIKVIPQSIIDIQPLITKIIAGIVIYLICIMILSNKLFLTIKNVIIPIKANNIQ